MRVPVIQTERQSFMHRRDPRVKVALFILLIVFIYAAPNWLWMLGMVGIGVALAFLSKAPARWLTVLLLLQIPNVIGLIVIPAAGQLLEGDFAFDERMQFGVKLALAWIAAILIGVSLISSMEIDELVEGLKGIGIPKRFAFVVGYAFLLIYLGINDILRIADAMRLKGAELIIRRPLRFVLDLIRMSPPIIFTVVRRGADMAAALDLRGFSASEDRVRRARLKFDFADATALACGLLIVGYAGAVRAEIVPPPDPAMAPAKQSSDKH
jgi:energy-coupling factor transport system permease protein